MAELDQENNVETEDKKSEVGIDNLKVLENIEEFTMHQNVWAEGYRGFVQLITLIMLSEKLKESDTS